VTGLITDRRVVRAHLAEAGVRPSKKLGQSFLVDDGVLASIEQILARVSPETIVEIGPGLGAVTDVLLRHARRIIAVEVDRRLAASLGERLGASEGLDVRNENVLRFDVAGALDDGHAYVVGSLPYRITAPILKWLIGQRGVLSGALLITQREVAEKIAASPGKEGSALGILVRAYGEVDIVRRVNRGSFFPVPEVDSTLWSLTFLEHPRFESDSEAFFSVVRALYGTRRKMIRGALRALLPAEAIGAVLEEARIDGAVRGEELDFEQLDQLAAAARRLDAP